MLPLRQPKGMLPYIEFVDELLLLTQSHQRKGTKNVNYRKKQQLLLQKTIEIKQLKQLATFKYNFISYQTADFLPCSGFPEITQLCSRGKCSAYSSVWEVISWKECNAEAQPLSFNVRRSQWREHRIWVCSRLVSWWLRVLIGQRISIFSVVEWHKSCRSHVTETVWVQKHNRVTLLIIQPVMLIVTGNALGFSTGSGNVIPFSVDLSDLCKNFRVESNTKIKIYIGHDVLLIREVHNVIERNSLFEFLARNWYITIFWTEIRKICKLCRMIRRDLGYFVAAHRFLQRENFFNFDKVEHWILIVSRDWWDTSPKAEFVSRRKKRVANM